MNSIKAWYKVGTICMNSGNSKISDLHRILLNFSDQINLNRSGKYVALSNLTIYYKKRKFKKVIKKND